MAFICFCVFAQNANAEGFPGSTTNRSLGLASEGSLSDPLLGLGEYAPGQYAIQSAKRIKAQEVWVAPAYFNQVTNEMFVGDRIFDAADHVAAKQTWGIPNTKQPQGPGWVGLPESSYRSYMAKVNGNDVPDQAGTEVIYRNCVIEKSQNQPESVVREIRAACRDISNDPSIIERWKWGQ
jgi:hypothetical protein